MGTWGTGIKQNDSAADIYDEYFEYYDKGMKPADIARKLITDNEETIAGEAGGDFWFPLALAQWETNSLTQQVIERVTEIITAGSDLAEWKDGGASDENIAERKMALDDFLKQIRQPNLNPVQPGKVKEKVDPKIEIRTKPHAVSEKPWWKFW